MQSGVALLAVKIRLQGERYHMLRFLSAFLVATLVLANSVVYAHPYWDQQKVPKDASFSAAAFKPKEMSQLKAVPKQQGISVLRVQVDWNADETYRINHIMQDYSGTPALLMRSQHLPRLGSYHGVLKDSQGKAVFFDAVGTGKEYRKLTRAISFRFPAPMTDMTFEMYAENPQTGKMEKVISQLIDASALPAETPVADVEVKELAQASELPALRVNIYAEGYTAAEKQAFWSAAQKAVQALQREKFPGIERLSFYGVFHASNRHLGSPEDQGLPIPEYDTFLGLYFPYWNKFGRWYDVIYPTREAKLRRGFAASAYDYPIVLVNDSGYWGVGNYLSYTAIPANNASYFTYLLLHEFGHFFGLNEEYEGGGRTELEFAPEMQEPWSQNITFLRDTKHENLKWKKWVDVQRKLPTPFADWRSSPPVYGAYLGGYADSEVHKGRSYKPGLNCTMESKKHFCDVCTDAIHDVIQNSLGESN
jgi:hypothetical protein